MITCKKWSSGLVCDIRPDLEKNRAEFLLARTIQSNARFAAGPVPAGCAIIVLRA
jgi:hypothetical protein